MKLSRPCSNWENRAKAAANGDPSWTCKRFMEPGKVSEESWNSGATNFVNTPLGVCQPMDEVECCICQTADYVSCAEIVAGYANVA